MYLAEPSRYREKTGLLERLKIDITLAKDKIYLWVLMKNIIRNTVGNKTA